VGQIFLRLIQMMVVPIVLFSIISGTAGIGDPKKLGSVGVKTIVYFMLTTIIAISVGLFFTNLFQPGAGISLAGEAASFEPTETPSLIEMLIKMFPVNPIEAMANADMLQIIIFALIFGVTLGNMGEKSQLIITLVNDLNDAMISVVNLIMRLAPYGVFALMAQSIASQGAEVLFPMLKYVAVVLGSLFFHAAFVFGLLVALLAKMNPLYFFRNALPALTIGFSTSSSAATLPVTMRVVRDNFGVRNEIGSFIVSLGATVNMNGTALYQGIAALFIAQASGIALTFNQQLTIVATATLAAVGTAGVPAVGIIMLTMVLSSVGLPLEGIGVIMGVDRLLDMFRTAMNILGDISAAVIIGVREDAIDKGRLMEELKITDLLRRGLDVAKGVTEDIGG
ncbi:MAG: dicarboxylate/amino acid:cation symporter, partial [Clostridia bacterium]|nr:dicarboxylate/amino acid:cation symporter [Clostridia bacterium]